MAPAYLWLLPEGDFGDPAHLWFSPERGVLRWPGPPPALARKGGGTWLAPACIRWGHNPALCCYSQREGGGLVGPCLPLARARGGGPCLHQVGP